MKLKKLLESKTIKNAGWLIAGRVIQMIVNILVSILIARYLGPSNYGLVNYGIAYTTFFSSLANLGINNVLVKEFVDHPNEDGMIIGTSLFLRAISSFLSVITIVGLVCIVDANEIETIIVVALCSLSLFFHIFEVINYWFQSRLQSKVTAIVTLIAHTITSIYKVILIVNGMDVLWFAFATSLDYICVGIMLLYFYKKNTNDTIRVSFEYAKVLLSKSWHFILPGIMIAIYGQTDKVMLKQMVDLAETGYYSTAVSLSAGWCFVLNALIDSIFPSIMKAYNKDKELFKTRNRQLYALIFYTAIIVSVLYTIFAKPMILILYGETYLPVVMPLRIITWYTAFSYLGGARNAWVVCEDRQKYIIYTYAVSAFANVVLNYLLIPYFGASGAAFASLVTQIMSVLIVPFFIKDLKENSVLMIEAIMLKGLKGGQDDSI